MDMRSEDAATEGMTTVAGRQLGKGDGGRRLLVRFADDEVAEGRSPDLDLEKTSWDTRPPQLESTGGERRWTRPRREAPLIELLSEIRGLRGLRHRGQISDVEYERRRNRVLEKI